MGAVADAGATKGVLGDAGTAGDSERGGMADGRARVPEVLALSLHTGANQPCQSKIFSVFAKIYLK